MLVVLMVERLMVIVGEAEWRDLEGVCCSRIAREQLFKTLARLT